MDRQNSASNLPPSPLYSIPPQPMQVIENQTGQVIYQPQNLVQVQNPNPQMIPVQIIRPPNSLPNPASSSPNLNHLPQNNRRPVVIDKRYMPNQMVIAPQNLNNLPMTGNKIINPGQNIVLPPVVPVKKPKLEEPENSNLTENSDNLSHQDLIKSSKNYYNSQIQNYIDLKNTDKLDKTSPHFLNLLEDKYLYLAQQGKHFSKFSFNLLNFEAILDALENVDILRKIVDTGLDLGGRSDLELKNRSLGKLLHLLVAVEILHTLGNIHLFKNDFYMAASAYQKILPKIKMILRILF